MAVFYPRRLPVTYGRLATFTLLGFGLGLFLGYLFMGECSFEKKLQLRGQHGKGTGPRSGACHDVLQALCMPYWNRATLRSKKTASQSMQPNTSLAAASRAPGDKRPVCCSRVVQ
jgi:hypothetical protein